MKPTLITLSKLKAYLKHTYNGVLKILASQRYLFIKERLYQYARLMRLDRPIGIFLLLWPALWAIWIASEGKPDISILITIIIGAVLTRSAGCVINDYIDRDLDRFVKRTENRPLACGAVKPREALVVFSIIALSAFGLVFLLNALVMKLAIVSIFLIILYPLAKRLTYMPQAFLGTTFALAVPMAYAAQAGELSKTAWLLYITTVLWIFAYDTIYAMVDRDDDIKIGIKSTAILFGDADVSIIIAIHTIVLLALLMLGQQLSFGVGYYSGLFAAAVCVTYQYVQIKNRQREACFKAFLSNHYFGMSIFLGLVAQYTPSYFI